MPKEVIIREAEPDEDQRCILEFVRPLTLKEALREIFMSLHQYQVEDMLIVKVLITFDKEN